jgi:two-component system, chemotaxis family, chemotaxis protein CheY
VVKTCLIVDDSAVIRKVAKRILSDLPFAITESDYGSDALMKCRVQMPDVIMLDHVLPDMTAIEFIENIKRRVPQNMPSILLCISEFDVVRIMKAKRAGAAGYVLKPFTRQTLLASFQNQVADLAA